VYLKIKNLFCFPLSRIVRVVDDFFYAKWRRNEKIKESERHTRGTLVFSHPPCSQLKTKPNKTGNKQQQVEYIEISFMKKVFLFFASLVVEEDYKILVLRTVAA
jgi:hypothetical protein